MAERLSPASGEDSLRQHRLAGHDAPDAEGGEAYDYHLGVAGSEYGLERALDFRCITHLSISIILGLDVFLSLGLAAQMTGPSVSLAIVVACCAAFVNNSSSRRMSSKYASTGGAYEYGSRFVSSYVGFAAGWLLLCSLVISAASTALTASTYVLAIAHIVSHASVLHVQMGTIVIALLWVGITAVLLPRGWKVCVRANLVLLLITLSTLLYFCIAGGVVFANLIRSRQSLYTALPFFTSAVKSTWSNHDTVRNFMEAVQTMFVALVGFGYASIMAGEIKNPRKNFNPSGFTSLLFSGIVYLVVGTISVGIATQLQDLAIMQSAPGEGELSDQNDPRGYDVAPLAPLAALAGKVFPLVGQSSRGAAVIVSIGALSASINLLLNLALAGTRLVYAMARRGDFSPQTFTRLGKTNQISRSAQQAPYMASMLFCASTALVVVVSLGNITSAFPVFSASVLVYHSVLHASSVRATSRPEERGMIRWISFSSSAWCVLLALFIDPRAWFASIIALLIGLLWHKTAQGWYCQELQRVQNEQIVEGDFSPTSSWTTVQS